MKDATSKRSRPKNRLTMFRIACVALVAFPPLIPHAQENVSGKELTRRLLTITAADLQESPLYPSLSRKLGMVLQPQRELGSASYSSRMTRLAKGPSLMGGETYLYSIPVDGGWRTSLTVAIAEGGGCVSLAEAAAHASCGKSEPYTAPNTLVVRTPGPHGMACPIQQGRDVNAKFYAPDRACITHVRISVD
ncbi:hypothetical protein [Polaromonas sp. JS666]|uniref:hypothetical protein n=1 Tax=Polaromonas sp. (strain JS666 / ATCC BAA-500) TaxID=296591 RepID=UPI00088245DC|nr:hypothetical protein [Polaromonas sp. JS666]SDO22495.1 hypothetical protein SAMN05720382_11921 [Polaromonas sp. JS666]